MTVEECTNLLRVLHEQDALSKLQERSTNLGDFILTAVTWDMTYEGVNYWHRLYKKYS